MRLVALLHLRREPSPARLADLETVVAGLADEVSSVRRVHLGKHLPGCVGGGHYTLDALVDGGDANAVLGAPSLRDLVDASDVVERLDPVAFESQHVSIAEPAIKNCVKRTLFLRVFPETPADVVEEFERVIMAMPDHIDAIRNWACSRTDPTAVPTSWTHVWEQEYADKSGLEVDYMMHPYHWGLVDGWFDPECPQSIVDRVIAHVYCPAAETILGWK